MAFFATAAVLFFYPISRKIGRTICDDLALRRKGFTSSGNTGA
jgi:hypothetical protein